MEACVTKPLCTKTVYMNTNPVEDCDIQLEP